MSRITSLKAVSEKLYSLPVGFSSGGGAPLPAQILAGQRRGRTSIRIVPHHFRHSYATEMLRAGVSFPVLMELLGHTNPEMTMHYVDVALTDLQREFHQARAHPKHLVPQPKASSPQLRAGLEGTDARTRALITVTLFKPLVLAPDMRAIAAMPMKSAAELEDGTEKSAVTSGPLASARELLGEMLRVD